MRDMKLWVRDMLETPRKKPLPILSFPAANLMGVTVHELVRDSDLQSKGMKLIVDRSDPAAAISYMDLSVEAEAFGSTIHFSEDEIPTVIGAIVTDEDEAEALQVPQVGEARTGIYLDAAKKALELIQDRPVFAGAIGPYSLAGRLMDVSEAMILCYEEPDMVHAVMEKTTEFLISYIRAYKDLGLHGVLLAEPLTGMLSPGLAEEFSAPYVKRIVDAVQDDHFLVIYHNCGDNVLYMADSILSCGAGAYHFGNAINLAEMLPKVPDDCLVFGNVDPAGIIAGSTPDRVQAATEAVMEACFHRKNFCISSGCDIPPHAPWENIDAFFAGAEYFYDTHGVF